jgi:hypothetical protein
MAAIAAVQVLLFALGAAGVRNLGIFNNTGASHADFDQRDTGCDRGLD